MDHLAPLVHIVVGNLLEFRLEHGHTVPLGPGGRCRMVQIGRGGEVITDPVKDGEERCRNGFLSKMMTSVQTPAPPGRWPASPAGWWQG